LPAGGFRLRGLQEQQVSLLTHMTTSAVVFSFGGTVPTHLVLDYKETPDETQGKNKTSNNLDLKSGYCTYRGLILGLGHYRLVLRYKGLARIMASYEREEEGDARVLTKHFHQELVQDFITYSMIVNDAAQKIEFQERFPATAGLILWISGRKFGGREAFLRIAMLPRGGRAEFNPLKLPYSVIAADIGLIWVSTNTILMHWFSGNPHLGSYDEWILDPKPSERRISELNKALIHLSAVHLWWKTSQIEEDYLSRAILRVTCKDLVDHLHIDPNLVEEWAPSLQPSLRKVNPEQLGGLFEENPNLLCQFLITIADYMEEDDWESPVRQPTPTIDEERQTASETERSSYIGPVSEPTSIEQEERRYHGANKRTSYTWEQFVTWTDGDVIKAKKWWEAATPEISFKKGLCLAASGSGYQ